MKSTRSLPGDPYLAHNFCGKAFDGDVPYQLNVGRKKFDWIIRKKLFFVGKKKKGEVGAPGAKLKKDQWGL